MDDVQFETDTFVSHTPHVEPKKGFVDFLVAHKFVKNTAQAQILLIAVIVIAFGAAFFLVRSSSTHINPHPEQVPSVAGPRFYKKP